MVGDGRQPAGDEIYRLRDIRITGADYYPLDLRPGLAVTRFAPDLPDKSIVGFQIAGMDIRRLQFAVGGIRHMVLRLGYSENQLVTFPGGVGRKSQTVISQRTQSFSLHGST